MTDVCKRVIGKANTPGQVGRLAVAAAVQKTTDPAENKRQHKTYGEDIKITTDGQFVIHQEEDDEEYTGNNDR